MNSLVSLLPLVAKFMVATLAFSLFYWFLVRKHATYAAARSYLLALPLACLLMALSPLQITLPGRTVYLPASTAQASSAPAPTPSAPQPAATVAPSSPATPTDEWQPASFLPAGLTPLWAAFFVWLAGALALLLVRLANVAQVMRLKRRSRIEKRADGTAVVTAADVRSPFSFYRIIFVPAHILPAQRRIILKHEEAHIALRHYRDVWLMESLAALLWFNPMIWWIRAELRRIHEYEADRSVLQSGEDLYAYQTTLLQEAVRNNFVLANGFSQSFVRRRFLNMKESRSRQRPSRLVRLTGGVLLAGLCAVFSIGIGRAETRYLYSAPKHEPAPLIAQAPQTATPAVPAPQPQTAIAQAPAPQAAPSATPEAEPQPAAAEAPTEAKETPAVTEALPAPKPAEIAAPARKKHTWTKKPRKVRGEKKYDYRDEHTYSEWTDAEVAPRTYMMSVRKGRNSWKYGMLRTPEATYVFEIGIQRWEWHWWRCAKETQLIDCDTQESYFIRGNEHFPFHRYFWIRDQKDQPVVFMNIFPPLPDSVKTVIFTNVGCSEMRDRTVNSNTPPMKVSDLEANWRDYFAARAKENR